MAFVINISTECINDPVNRYGYWAGKTYKLNGDEYPVWDSSVTARTKRYSHKRRAESMARKLFDRCDYVTTWNIESVD